MNKFNTKRNGVRVQILETGEEFNSIQACADRLGVSVQWLGDVTRGHGGRCTCRGYHIIRVDDPRENFDTDRTEYRGRPGIKVRIRETGEEFGSMLECSKSVGCNVGKIHDVLHGNYGRKSYKGLHFELIK